MIKHTTILHLEDNIADAELVKATFATESFDCNITLVDCEEDYRLALKNNFDLILIDYTIPNFSGLDAIKLAKDFKIKIPIIVLSGMLGDELAIELMKQGAIDYVLKDNMTRLIPSINRAIREHELHKKQIEHEMIQKELMELTHAGMYKINESGKFLFVNDQFCQMLGYNSENFLGNNWINFLHPDDKAWFIPEWQSKIKAQNKFTLEVRLQQKQGNTIWIQSSNSPQFDHNTQCLISYIGTIINITDLKTTQLKLEEIARYDPLTDLPNRRLLDESLSITLENNRRKGTNFAFLYIDIDNFKSTNDLLGHTNGDILLKEIGKKFTLIIRKSDLVSRIGGDEFVIILNDIKSINQISLLIDRIFANFEEPIMIENHKIHTTISVGVVTSINSKIKEIANSEDIIKLADQALYQAKEKGKNCVEYYSKEVSKKIDYILEIKKKLSDAIKNDEFYLVYQPQFSLLDNQLVGCEALIRLANSEQGIPPNIFIPIAEENKQIDEITEWVIDQSFLQLSIWKKQFNINLASNFLLSINLSASQTKNNRLIKYISQKLLEYHIEPQLVILELTETAVMENVENMKKLMIQLSEMGISIAIDDFGTGYSSLSYLKMLPVKILKIDKSFMKDLSKDHTSHSIVKSVISMSQALDIDVIAEGVETQSQANILKELQCRYVQGFYYSKPLTKEDMTKFILKHNS